MGNVTKFRKHSTLHCKILVDYISHILIMSEHVSYEENRFENQDKSYIQKSAKRKMINKGLETCKWIIRKENVGIWTGPNWLSIGG